MKWTVMMLFATLLSGCATTTPPPTVPHVDLPRYMGDWYVVGGILTSFEEGAHHAIENYRLDDKGRIQTTFTFRKDAFDGPLKKFTPVGFVHNRETFAEWRMQFIWPFKSPFLIIYLDPDYRATAISTHDRKHLWIMSRTPQMPDLYYQEILALARDQGFAMEKLVKVPQPGDAQAVSPE